MSEPLPPYRITVNGQLIERDRIDGRELLIDFLHEELGLTGTKFSCGIGACGACKVAVQETPDGPLIPVLACFARLNSLTGMYVTTVESLADGERLHPLQTAFLEDHAFQCGFSTPGFLMAAYSLMDELRRSPVPEDQLDRVILGAISGNVCRCTGYIRYFHAIRRVILATPGLVRAEPLPVPPITPAGVTFRVDKRSSNDLREKSVFGLFAPITGEVRFDGFLSLDTCSAWLTVNVEHMRTGERIRDLNLRKFLFGRDAEFTFQLAGARATERRMRLDNEAPGSAVPVTAFGNLFFGNLESRGPSIPVSMELLLRVLPEGLMRITSLAPVRVDPRDFDLPFPAFAREFGLQLSPVVEVSLDVELPYRIF